MALEAIQEVTRVEEKAKASREAAAAQARQQLQDAQREARQIVQEAARQAEEKVKARMARAEEEAAVAARQEVIQAEKDCDILQKIARNRLDTAAQVIVEKVVNR